MLYGIKYYIIKTSQGDIIGEVININKDKKRFLFGLVLTFIFTFASFSIDALNIFGAGTNTTIAYAASKGGKSSGGFKSSSSFSSSKSSGSGFKSGSFSGSSSSNGSSSPSKIGSGSKSSTSSYKSGSFSNSTNSGSSSGSDYKSGSSSNSPSQPPNYQQSKKTYIPIPIPWSFGRSSSSFFTTPFYSYSSPYSIVSTMIKMFISFIIIIILINLIRKFMRRK